MLPDFVEDLPHTRYVDGNNADTPTEHLLTLISGADNKSDSLKKDTFNSTTSYTD